MEPVASDGKSGYLALPDCSLTLHLGPQSSMEPWEEGLGGCMARRGKMECTEQGGIRSGPPNRKGLNRFGGYLMSFLGEFAAQSRIFGVREGES